MGYLHINNLYKDQRILMFRECYALEKVHGTSAHIAWSPVTGLHFFSGGEKHDRFVGAFDRPALTAAFEAIGHEMLVFGEAYGGKQQGMSARYGKELRFVVFDVKIGESWLSVPNAADVATKLGLRFVDYARVSTDLVCLDAERDKPTTEGKRNGVDGDHPREGVVLRPLEEFRANNGERIIAKHKRDEERETKTPREVSPEKFAALTEATAIATEWVTPTRLDHVLQTFGSEPVGIERTGDVIRKMVDDVLREGAGELVDSKEARAAIGRECARLFKERCRRVPQEETNG